MIRLLIVLALMAGCTGPEPVVREAYKMSDGRVVEVIRQGFRVVAVIDGKVLWGEPK